MVVLAVAISESIVTHSMHIPQHPKPGPYSKIMMVSSSRTWQARRSMKKEENACQNALNVLPFRPTEVKSNWLKIIATVAEATAIRPHSRTPRIQLINQG
jgi:hypothetical protein